MVLASALTAQENRTVVSQGSVVALDSTSVHIRPVFTGDANGNGYTFIEYWEGTAPRVILGYFPGTASWRSPKISSLRPGFDHFVQLTYFDPDGVVGQTVQTFGPITLSTAAPSNVVTAGTATVTARTDELEVYAPYSGDADLDSDRSVYVGPTATGPWGLKAVISNSDVLYARVRSLDPVTARYVMVEYTDPDGVTGSAMQVVGPLNYTGRLNLAHGRPFQADPSANSMLPVVLGTGIVQLPSNTAAYTFANLGQGFKQVNVDLGSATLVDTAAVFFADGVSVPTTWRIEVSANQTNWTTVYTGPGNQCLAGQFTPPAVSWDNPTCFLRASFAPVSTRFVRYTYDSNVMPYGPGGSLTQFEVYGPEVVISGRVATASDAGVPSVEVSVTGGTTVSAVTDTQGNYTLPAVAGGVSYTVTPALAGWAFTPPSVTLAAPTSNQTLNFVATACLVSFTPASASAGSGGGPGTAQLNIGAGCAWTAVSEVPWIVLTSAASGSGASTIGYTVAANATAAARTGNISVNGVNFAITQAALSCTAVLNPVGAAVSSRSGNGSFSVTRSAGCGAWSATSSDGWLIANGSATGNGSVSYSYGVNADTAARTGTITVAGSTFQVTQDGVLCSYTLGPDLAAGAAGGPGSIALTAPGACSWTAVSQASWITLTGAGQGSGSALIGISVAANPGATARIGTVLVGGRTFTVTQAGQGCTYTLTPSSATVPGAGGTETIRISAPAGCSWNATSGAPWLALSASPSGSGNGSVQFTAAVNSTGTTRAGTITIARRVFIVTQPAQAIACVVAAGVPPVIRAQGLTELTSDIVVSCSGTVPAGGATFDLTATLNTNVTSRVVSAATDSTEAVLLVNDPASPVLGSTAFLGRITGYNTLRWTGITVPAGALNRTFRITNIRANASLASTTASPAVVTALVEVKSSRLVTVSNATQTVAMVSDAVTVSAGSAGAGPAVDTLALPVAYNEGFPTAFKIKVAGNQSPSQIGVLYNTESGFVNASLGSTVGLADSGTRLRLRLSNIPAGVRVYAPLRPVAGTGARLLSEDAFLNVGTHFNGAYQELPVASGSALAMWEIDVADPVAIESRVFSIAFSNATQEQVNQIRTTLSGSIAPLSGSQLATGSTVPRFFDPSAPQNKINLRLTSGPVVRVAGATVAAKTLSRLAVVGNFQFSYQVQNDSSEPATDVTIRGNLPPGFTIPSCSATGGQCSTSGNEFTVVLPTLGGGATSTITLTGGSTADLEPGYFVESTATASADQLDTDLASNRASSGVTVESCASLGSAGATIPAAGGSFTINVPACSLWTATTETSWLTVTNGSSGSGAGQVTYSAEANSGGARSGFINVAGQTFAVNQQAAGNGGCTYSIAPGSTSVPQAGVNTTFALTATGTGCAAWTASSNATWAQIFPLSGTGSSTMYYRVFPNFNTTGRSAAITVAGQTFFIQQSGNTGTRMQRAVQLAYFSFLGRVPSAGELNFHVNSGLPEATILRNFWNSDEFALGGRLIAGLYVGLLERDPEYGGWQFQRLALADAAVSQVGITGNFLNGAEYVGKNGTQDNTAFVTFLYQKVLGRTPSAGELAAQVAQLQAGVSRAQLAADFLVGAEFRNKVTGRLHAFLLYSALLLRDGSLAERQGVMTQLAAGVPVDTFISSFVGGAEFNALLQ